MEPMKPAFAKTATAVLLALGFAMAQPELAQSDGGMVDGKQGGSGPGMQQMSGLMHDMADQMTAVSGHLSMGRVDAGRQREMGKRLGEMAVMPDKMSGMTGKGMVSDPAARKQMEGWGERMKGMMTHPVMPAKP